MIIKIQTITVGVVVSNCYIVYNDETLESIIIDPGAEGKRLIKFIQDNNLTLKYIVNTHGHPDHIGANKQIKKTYTTTPLCVHKEDAFLLTSKQIMMSVFFGLGYGSPPADIILKEGDLIEISGLKLKILHTPGHTPGSISLLSDNFIFTGDTLFWESIGRTDLPGGSMELLMESIKKKILTLDKKLVVYPGHGPPTTIERELNNNPFL